MTSLISIPIWVIIVFLPMMFSIFLLLIASAKLQAVMRTDIKNINERLTRIEQTLDNKCYVKK